VLRSFLSGQIHVGVSEIGEALGTPKSSTSRLLAAMRDGGLLEQDPQTLKYRPGLLLFRLGAIYLAHLRIYDLLTEFMIELVEETGHVGSIGALDGDHVVILQVQVGSNPIRTAVETGRRVPAYATALGKALLARFDPAAVERLYPKGLYAHTRHTIATLPRLHEALSKVRETRLAPMQQEMSLGTGAIATSFAKANQPDEPLSVALSYPLAAVTIKQVEDTRRVMLERGRLLGERLGDPFWLGDGLQAVSQFSSRPVAGT
jgi:DNA-binding IclR family transcriptional regulator